MVENRKSALIVGASGLVGNNLLHVLLKAEEYEKVTVIVRRTLGIEHPKLCEIICDFEQLHKIQKYFEIDEVFCCLGTTIKKAKTKENMYKIDVEYPLAVANIANMQGVKHFLLVSSMNANANSNIFYSRIKGILEEELKGTPFDSLSIFRPSLLLGQRDEFRLGEMVATKIFQAISPILKESWKNRFAIEATTVAEAMYKVAQMDKKGVTTYNPSQMAILNTKC